jgi:hypothetical protein
METIVMSNTRESLVLSILLTATSSLATAAPAASDVVKLEPGNKLAQALDALLPVVNDDAANEDFLGESITKAAFVTAPGAVAGQLVTCHSLATFTRAPTPPKLLGCTVQTLDQAPATTPALTWEVLLKSAVSLNPEAQAVSDDSFNTSQFCTRASCG